MDEKTIARFWSKVEKTDGCWVWKGCRRSRAAYGCFIIGKQKFQAHRISWELAHGSPPALCVLHRCDNVICVNPGHLFLGTRTDNNADRHAKGRSRGPQGTEHPASRLTPDAVRDIRARYVRGRPGIPAPNGITALARDFGVSHGIVSKIIRRRLWCCVE